MTKTRVKLCFKHRHHETHTPPNEEYFNSHTTKNGTVMYSCKTCYTNIMLNLAYWKVEQRAKRKASEAKSKENLDDWYVRRELLRGTKGLYYEQIPKDLVELKRATIRLQRLIEKIKRPLMTCKKHGNLWVKDVNKAGTNPSGSKRYKCKHCMKDLHHDHYLRNKDRISLKTKIYRINNPEKMREIRKNYREKKSDDTKHDGIKGKSITGV